MGVSKERLEWYSCELKSRVQKKFRRRRGGLKEARKRGRRCKLRWGDGWWDGGWIWRFCDVQPC